MQLLAGDDEKGRIVHRGELSQISLAPRPGIRRAGGERRIGEGERETRRLAPNRPASSASVMLPIVSCRRTVVISAKVCRTEAREVPVRLTCCRELGGRELPRRSQRTLRLAWFGRSALLFLIRTPILKVCQSHLIAKNC